MAELEDGALNRATLFTSSRPKISLPVVMADRAMEMTEVIYSPSTLCGTDIGLVPQRGDLLLEPVGGQWLLVLLQRIAARGDSRRGIPLAWTEDHPSTTVTSMNAFVGAFRDNGPIVS